MTDQIKRRAVIALLGGAAAWPFAARAQHPTKRATVGLMAPDAPAMSNHRIAAFTERLRDLGWIEGSAVKIERRWAEGRQERFAEIAAELVRLEVDVIVTWGTATVLAAKQATTTVPIVFTIVSDPVGVGLVASLARPGGNLTGLSTQHTDAAGKRLELLREVVPQLRRLAIMANMASPASVVELRDVQKSAHWLGMEVVILEIRGSDDIAPAFAALPSRTDALFVAPEQLINTNRDRLAALALAARLPTMHGFRDAIVAGGLLSYGPNYLDMFRRTAEIVDKVLRGAKPADLPVEQPTKFELILNLKTAKALGLEIPDRMLALADEVIE